MTVRAEATYPHVMRFAWVLVAALTGCRFYLPAETLEDAATGSIDAGIDTPAGSICFGVGLVKPCFPTAPTGIVTLPSSLDTSTSPLCSTTATAADGFCVIAGETIRVETAVGVIGAKPLVLVATMEIEISATLDAASHRGNTAPNYTTTQIGAGSDPAGGCNAGTAPGISSGGAGGTLGAFGGNGGDGAGGGPTDGGVAGGLQAITDLRGGCRGQNGVTGTPGQGGRGGGAVYLIANTAINISGLINASGEGGHPGITGVAGAGGGGSGGMIGLDAPTIANTGIVFANGASGGEGSGLSTSGVPGPEPNSVAASPAPLSGTSSGGDGGTGSGGGTATGGNGSNAGNNGGGGGGGGGVGVIKVYRGTLTGQHSPPPTP